MGQHHRVLGRKSLSKKNPPKKRVFYRHWVGGPKEMSRAPLGTLRKLILIKGCWGTEKAEG